MHLRIWIVRFIHGDTKVKYRLGLIELSCTIWDNSKQAYS
jgi:hypothetical protein